MPPGARSPLAAGSSLPLPEHTHGVEVRRIAPPSGLELRLQLLSRPHLEVLVVDDEPSAWRQRERAIDRSQTVGVQNVVVIQPSPALAVIAVRNVELRSCVTD